MNSSDDILSSLTRNSEKNSGDKDEEKDGGVKRNEKAHYIVFIQYIIYA